LQARAAPIVACTRRAQERKMKEWGLYLWLEDQDRRAGAARAALPVGVALAVPAALAALVVCAFAFLAV
jgi:hypothetical protein